jgi:hypothetical protein
MAKQVQEMDGDGGAHDQFPGFDSSQQVFQEAHTDSELFRHFLKIVPHMYTQAGKCIRLNYLIKMQIAVIRLSLCTMCPLLVGTC